MNTITCPNCNKPVEISQALRHEIEDELIAKEREKHQEELQKTQKDAEEKALKRMSEQFEWQLKELREDNKAKEARTKELLDKLTQQMDETRKMQKERDEVALEMRKKLDIEEKRIKEEAIKKAEEEQHNKLSQKDKQLQDALREIEQMKRKLSQGSQQLQGEAFELEFENMLKSQYPNDKILPVGKGVRGGDIVQEVWDGRGNLVGKILWELKNTKTWSEQWTEKLKNDKREVAADEAVLISEVLPQTVKTAGFYKSLWVTNRPFVIPLADTLRAKLIQLYYVKNSVKGKDERIEYLYQYLSGVEFKHRVEAIIDAFTNMQNEIEKEKRYFQNKWSRDEKNIRQVIDNTYGMHGDLKAIVGNALPQIKGLDHLEVTDGNGEIQTKF